MSSTPSRALIVVDVQNEYFDGPLRVQFPPPAGALDRILTTIDVAGVHELPVVVVQHTKPAGALVFAAGSPGWALHPALQARRTPAWKLVSKTFGSIFSDTDVAEWLAKNDIDTITIAGFMTNNCILASAVEAEARGLKVEVLADATGSIHLANDAGTVSARELHETLMVLLHSNFAAVTTVEVWSAAVRTQTAVEKSNLVASATSGARSQST
jgi:nicotinamidase-related amidase